MKILVKWLQNRLRNLGDVTSYSTIPPRAPALCCWHHNLIPKAWWGSSKPWLCQFPHCPREWPSPLPGLIFRYSGHIASLILPLGPSGPSELVSRVVTEFPQSSMWLISSLPCTCPFCACSYKRPPARKKTFPLPAPWLTPSHHRTQVAYSSLTSLDKRIADWFPSSLVLLSSLANQHQAMHAMDWRGSLCQACHRCGL